MLFRKTSDRQLNVALTIVRLVVGAIFIAHGGQKLFVYGLDGVAGGFAQMGVPFASFMGPFIGFVEFFGGIALILGLLTRLAALGIFSTMIGAIVLVHLPAGFFAPNGIEFPLSLAGAALALVFTGAGTYSVDALIGRRLEAAQAASGNTATLSAQRAA
jgi:putative oxidoreductase